MFFKKKKTSPGDGIKYRYVYLGFDYLIVWRYLNEIIKLMPEVAEA